MNLKKLHRVKPAAVGVITVEPISPRIRGSVTKERSKQLSERIAECHRQAGECLEKARLATDRQRRKFFLELEQRWLLMARTLEVLELESDFRSEVSQDTKK